jgi:hypothetical protein
MRYLTSGHGTEPKETRYVALQYVPSGHRVFRMLLVDESVVLLLNRVILRHVEA